MSRHASTRGGFLFHPLRFFEIDRVLVRFDDVAPFIVNCVADCVRFAVPQATERQRMGNQINAALVAARSGGRLEPGSINYAESLDVPLALQLQA
jgi:hypothetical protein